MNEVEFGSPEELRCRHPEERERWYSVSDESREGWGMIGDAVTHPEHGRCISVFIGQGRSVLITQDGRYVGDDVATDNYPRVEKGAWISEQLYLQAHLRQHV